MFLRGLEGVFMAALLASRAREPQVKLGGVEEGPGAVVGVPGATLATASYEVSWRA